MVNLTSDLLQPLLLFISPLAALINRINKSSFSAKFTIYLLRPLFWVHEFFLKYKDTNALLSISIFDDSARKAGFRVFYLKYRNWSRYEYFNKISTSLSLLNFLGVFSFSWFFFMLLLKIFPSTSVLPLTLDEFSYLSLYPIPFCLSISVLFCSPNSYASSALDTIVFCFVCDQEMFQGLFN